MTWQVAGVENTKLEKLKEVLRSIGSCIVAYSGGVDSVFLAYVANEVLGAKALAVIADSPSLPRRELAEALEVARAFQIPCRVIATTEFENAEYTRNPANRCYFCKSELFSKLGPLALKEGFQAVIYGENASDVGDYRPGAAAAGENKVRAPLKEVGLTKAEIRAFSAQIGLPTADKPQLACLSSRIPHGEEVSPEKLMMVEKAENILRDAGFIEVRVRHHELKLGALARIELGPGEIGRFLEDGLGNQLSERIREVGYLHVTLDLQGYRRGSLNRMPTETRNFLAAQGLNS